MLDIKRLAAKHHIPILESGHHHCHQGWVQLHCPFCAGGRSGWHLGFSLEEGNFNCWRCGGIKFWLAVPAILHKSEEDARGIIGDFQTSARPQRKQTARRKVLAAPPNAGPMLPVHRRYLEGRKFDPDALDRQWGLQGCGRLGGLWAWRIVFPIHDGDMVVAYQGRTVGELVRPKYRMTEDADCLVDPRGLLYGLQEVPGDAVIIVEGVTGVWRLGPGAVATFGIDWSRQQANRLRRFKRRFILFDPEPMAQRRAAELASHLALFPGETEVISGFTTDPGEFSDRKAARIKKELGLAT